MGRTSSLPKRLQPMLATLQIRIPPPKLPPAERSHVDPCCA